MHNAAFAYHGLPDRYALWPVAASLLAAQVAALRAPGFRGANVTIPYKSLVLPLVDELSLEPDVAALGALNTVVRRPDGTLLGLNTDVAGFLRALDAAAYNPHDADVVLVGAGGAARAVAWGLAQAGIRSLALINRSPLRAQELAVMLERMDLGGRQVRVSIVDADAPDVAPAVEGATLLVNATPVGAHGQQIPLEPTLLHPGLLVCDLIYQATPLLRAAAARGAATQDGLEMLVQQGALAFEAWTELPAPVEVMRQAAIDARGGQL